MSEVTTGDINALRRQIEYLQGITLNVSEQIGSVDNKVNTTIAQLEGLKRDFLQMMEDQKREGEFQRATTELVRVRQEVEQKFGKYMFVRDTMLGVLQATDAKLVRLETITRVSEELMLSTPRYWLSPCLIAVAAWIGNDQSLAERAIKVAMERDPEKTSLCMALICRRNGREDTCFEWLSLYFGRQKATDFSDSTFSFVDAYVNGVFGIDRYHRCDDYITSWVSEIRKTSDNFEKQQTEYWANYFASFSASTGGKYQELKNDVTEFPMIDGYLSRIIASEKIEEEFDTLNKSQVDQDALIRDIDDRLVALVSRYAEEEVGLREEEEYLQAVKEHRGDVETAKIYVEAKRKINEEKKMDLVEKMAEIISGGETKSLSERKTALFFLQNYINNGYHQFLKEKKEAFPSTININVDGWRGPTSDCQNMEYLYNDYANYMNRKRQEELNRINTKAGLPAMIAGGVSLLLGIILMIVLGGAGAFFGFLISAVGIVLGVIGIKSYRSIPASIQYVNSNYDNMIKEGQNRIYQAATQWTEVRNAVALFNSKEKGNLIA